MQHRAFRAMRTSQSTQLGGLTCTLKKEQGRPIGKTVHHRCRTWARESVTSTPTARATSSVGVAIHRAISDLARSKRNVGGDREAMCSRKEKAFFTLRLNEWLAAAGAVRWHCMHSRSKFSSPLYTFKLCFGL